jgi:lipopolysaccharide/colanic/teichoic acid biosynthesis glycosyltransferase
MTTAAVDRTDITPTPPAALPQHESATAVDVACRLVDVVLAAILLVVTLPLMVVVAIAIRLDSPGPALFRQRRLGRSLTPFTVNKFRTMTSDADPNVHRAFVLSLIAGEQPAQENGKPRFKLASDPRVTRVGRLLRRSSLDELPQLWNVLKGEMSLVGPRPAIAYEVEHYPHHWFDRFAVKPGLTGLWQVSGRSRLTVEDMVALDIEYVHRRSVRMNVWILVKTVPTVLSLRGAS